MAMLKCIVLTDEQDEIIPDNWLLYSQHKVFFLEVHAELSLRLEFGLTGAPDNLLFCDSNKALNILVIPLAGAWAAKRNSWTLTFNTTIVRNLRVRARLLPQLEQTRNDSKYHDEFQSLLSTSCARCGREKLAIAPWDERRSRCVGVCCLTWQNVKGDSEVRSQRGGGWGSLHQGFHHGKSWDLFPLLPTNAALWLYGNRGTQGCRWAGTHAFLLFGKGGGPRWHVDTNNHAHSHLRAIYNH